MEDKASRGNNFSKDMGLRKPAKEGESKVIKVKTGWHWLVEEENMPFIKCLL